MSERIDILLPLIAALPLLSAIATSLFGPRLLKTASHWPTILALFGSLCLALILLTDVRHASSGSTQAVGWEHQVDLWTWASVPGAYRGLDGDSGSASGPAHLQIQITMRADALTGIMLVMVTFVSLLVAIYSVGYMHGERGYWRFFTYVSLFVFSMVMLVSVSNFVLLYVFWEAVGLCSYLLIGFWYEKPAAAAAGKKAFLVNRVGDFGFALALFLIWTTYGTLNFHDTAADGRVVAGSGVGDGQPERDGQRDGQPERDGQRDGQPERDDPPERDGASVVSGVLGQTRLQSGAYVGGTTGLAICLLLMLGACGKSAQFPLHVWLPDAMEGPTPVSALIHAATMVTAGVYMVTRCLPLFLVSADAQMTVAAIGGGTALLAGFIALTQTDLKRVLAYSTVSQLGYMFLALGTGTRLGAAAGMFHLLTHAFFKALLFLGAGSVMHAMGGVIDVGRFGGLRRRMPITHATFLVGCLALAGVFPLAGFFSKDAIIAELLMKSHEVDFYETLYYGALLASFLTAIYTFRALFLTFYGPERVPADAGDHAHESPASMTGPLVILAVCAVFAGMLMGGFTELLWNTPSLAEPAGVGHPAAANPAAANPAAVHHGVDHDAVHAHVALISTGIAFAGIGVAAFFYLGGTREAAALARWLRPIYLLSRGKFFLDPIYTLFIVWPCLVAAAVSYWLDRYLIDGLVDGCARLPALLGTFLRGMQTGILPLYAMLTVLGLLALVGSLIL